MKSRIERLRKVFDLSPPERMILAQAWGLFLLVDLALRILAFKHIVALCQKSSPRKRQDFAPVTSPFLGRTVWLVEVAARYTPVNATCLKKALVLSWILGTRGIGTTLRIGVARGESIPLTAHAWLEREGEVLFGRQGLERHKPLFGA